MVRFRICSQDVVRCSLLSSCDEVREGERKQLDSSVLHAMDLDVPEDVLLFDVVKAPQHGSIISHGGEKPVKRRQAGAQSPVVRFTMTELTNGTFYMSVLKTCFTHRTEMNNEGVQVINYECTMGYNSTHYYTAKKPF